MQKTLALIAASLSLVACDSGSADEAGPVGEDEAQALSKAAEMLEDPRGPKRSGSPTNETIENKERERASSQ